MTSLIVFILVAVFIGTSLGGQGQLDFYVVDTEGGKAVLVVGPKGDSMLVDAGFPGFQGRDANRIVEVVERAGLQQIDYLVVTHYDLDHVGNVPAVAQKVRVKTFVDHGPLSVTDTRTKAMYEAYRQLATDDHRLVVRPGDRIPLAGVEVLVVCSAGDVIDRSVGSDAAANPLCKSTVPRQWEGTDEDRSENAQSVGLLFRFGRFRLLDLADLTWNKELALVCPVNRLGTVDVFMVSHHGHDISNSPALVHAIRPRVAILNNGARKFGLPGAMEVVRTSPGLEAFYQLHWSVAAGTLNSDQGLIANLEGGSDGHWIVVRASEDGTFTVTNGRTEATNTFPARP